MLLSKTIKSRQVKELKSLRGMQAEEVKSLKLEIQSLSKVASYISGIQYNMINI